MEEIPVDRFIKQHNHINYCEAIILKNGNIVYATPSHIECMIALTGFSREYLRVTIPSDASPIEWLVSEFDFVPVWYNYFKYHSLTKYQKRSLVLLKQAGVLSHTIVGEYTDEKQWMYRTGVLQELPKRCQEMAIITNSDVKFKLY